MGGTVELTTDQHISEHDRALWNEFVLHRRGVVPAERADSDDLLLLAAYLDGRLEEWDRSQLEQRLLDEPLLLETLMAAHAARDADAPAPQPVIAYALNCFPIRSQAVAAPLAARRRLIGAPAFAWSLAVFFVLAFCAVGVYVALERQDDSITAESPRRSGDALTEDLGRRNDSVFTDPARTYFDGTEVDD